MGWASQPDGSGDGGVQKQWMSSEAHTERKRM